jgi:RNA polymerase sigma factor (sigma-70 family)
VDSFFADVNPLISGKVSRFCHKYNATQHYDDICQDVKLVILKYWVDKYDPTKGKPATFIYSRLNSIINLCGFKYFNDNASLTEDLSNKLIFKDNNNHLLFNELSKDMCEEDRELFSLFYEGNSFTDIAKIHGCTPENIRQKLQKLFNSTIFILK